MDAYPVTTTRLRSGETESQCGTSVESKATRLTSRGAFGLLMSRLTTALHAGTVTR